MRRRPTRGSGIALAAAALAAVAGCGALADLDYPGEVLLTLHGRVVGVSPLPPLEAAMLWQRGPPPSTSDQELATRVPVEAGFPGIFTIRLYQPPPAEARRSLLPGEVSFARGNVAAVPYGTAADQVVAMPSTTSTSSYAMDVNHWVIHLDADVPPDTLTAWWLGAALPAGYHLVRVAPFDPTCQYDLDGCVADLVARGVPDDGTPTGTAHQFCLATYRLSPAPDGEIIELPLGTYLLAASPCPP